MPTIETPMLIRRLRLPLLVLGLLLALGYSAGNAQTMNEAGIIVRFADGSARSDCVKFPEASITGIELLRRSRFGSIAYLDPYSGYGEAVCKIGTDGCTIPTDDCFCKCQGLDCNYWAYYHRLNNQWEYSQVGAGSYEVRNGTLDGWAWGPGAINQSSEVQPPPISFEQVCVQPTATATATATMTPNATATPTITPTPTQTPTTSITPTTTPTPTITPTTSGTPPPTSTATPTINPALLHIEIELTPQRVATGGCATLTWRVSNAERAYLQIGNAAEQVVSLNSAMQVCPQTATLYTVRAVAEGESTSVSRSLEIDNNLPTATPIPEQSEQSESPLEEGQAASFTPLPEGRDPLAADPLTSPLPLVETAELQTQTEPTLAPPVVAEAATATPVRMISPAPTSSLRQMAPAPTNSLEKQSSPRRFLAFGGFALIVAALLGLGLWAYFRQSG
ncbi:MAG: hypothetical protein J5I90_04335 [Caldilineales bacterium]|nr:hypothetical protein [Caldilineales bacterium]